MLSIFLALRRATDDGTESEDGEFIEPGSCYWDELLQEQVRYRLVRDQI